VQIGGFNRHDSGWSRLSYAVKINRFWFESSNSVKVSTVSEEKDI